MKLRFIIQFSLLLAIPLLAHAGLPQSLPVPGGVAVVPLGSASANGGAKPQAWLGKQPVLVTVDNGSWYAVVGLSLDTVPGAHSLKVSMNGATQVQHFEVHSKDYPEQHITLKDKSKVDLSKPDLERAEREIALIRNLKRHWRETHDTDLMLELPSGGELGSRFGLRRFFNEQPRQPHAGLDVAVDTGTPVVAGGAGEVLAVGDYFFNGKTVFIDHGNGMITMYCHLDQIDVQEGQIVAKGQPIGLSGKTGRATGPHLHWSVVLNGAMVDPELFIPAKPVQSGQNGTQEMKQE
ncbi:MAG: peptidoglycan DD-metalloendopeptidase family protein [Gallionellaceae bacterium]|nr:peptidoglycan DD-metalloendopeptidase family protein [Gallionellaceae bacterium]